jgi:transposase
MPPHRSKDGPYHFLQKFKGYLQCDAYRGYDACFKDGRIVEVACWAHARRYLFDAQATDEAMALAMMEMIQSLYAVEREAKDGNMTPEERKTLRAEKAVPILKTIKAWLDEKKVLVLPKSPIGQAIAYALNNWTALNRYLEDGRLSIDNNASERSLRAIVLGRKNFMFCGSPEGAHRAAVIYSLVATCKLHQIDPYEYFENVLTRITDYPTNKIEDLVPPNWKALRNKVPA